MASFLSSLDNLAKMGLKAASTALAGTPGSEEAGSVYSLNNKRFVCRKLLGSGGYAFVYLVESEASPGHFFALKRLLVNSERLEGAKREIRFWSSIPSHPNIGMFFFFQSHFLFFFNLIFCSFFFFLFSSEPDLTWGRKDFSRSWRF